VTAAYLALAYLLGAIPTGYLAVKWARGIDIRTVGSGNMGATNVFRVLGWKGGLGVLAFDMGKGLAAVKLGPALGFPHGSWPVLAAALAAVLGHNYTCFLKFKGGKGVATSAGVLFGLAPVSIGASLAVFLLAFLSTRMISLGSLSGALVLPLAVWFSGEGGSGTLARWQPVLWLSLALAAFVWIRHLPNIKRILAGNENKLTWGNKK
jgi:glycerol-3-phosphate acyltransferase PlsY